MDLRTIIQGMTVWNWLALIAFIFFPLSALNAFFGLRSRYLDWQGSRSKVMFQKRLKQLSIQLKMIDQYRKEPQVLALKLLDDTSTILVIFLAAIAWFILAVLLRSLNPPGTGLVALGLALFFIAMDFVFAIQLSRLISRTRNPEAFAYRVFQFLHQGKVKGLLKENTELVESILTSEPFILIDGRPSNYIKEIRGGL